MPSSWRSAAPPCGPPASEPRPRHPSATTNFLVVAGEHWFHPLPTREDEPMGGNRTRLPAALRSCLFDLDGVLVSSVASHAAAWKQTFDAFLQARSERDGTPFVPFDLVHDYAQYVDGMKREDGVRTFLAARGITLPEGAPDDSPDLETVRGLGNRKNEALHATIEANGVEVYPGSVDFVHAVRADGLATAVVSSSANAPWILEVAGIADQFDACIDGRVAA